MFGPTKWEPGFERDPAKVYAGDCRAIGLELPDSIPDCAHVPRDAIRLGEMDLKIGERKDDVGVLVGSLPIVFSEPFTWVTVTIESKRPKEEPGQ